MKKGFVLFIAALFLQGCTSLRLQIFMDGGWDEIDEKVSPMELMSPPANTIRYVKIGQSTVLIQTPTLNVLTDPVWSDRSGPGGWGGPLRVRPPAVRFADIPKIDVILLSHNHYDHMDLPTLRSFFKKFRPVILTGKGNASVLEAGGIGNIVELEWWQEYWIKNMAATFVPAQHLSGRGFESKVESLWGGFVLRTELGPVYFAGDTGRGQFIKEIRRKFGPPFLSFLPIGGYEPRWYQRRFNLNPDDAVSIHLQLESRRSESIHYETFRTSQEKLKDPVEALYRARERRKVSPSVFVATHFGSPVTLRRAGTALQIR